VSPSWVARAKFAVQGISEFDDRLFEMAVEADRDTDWLSRHSTSCRTLPGGATSPNLGPCLPS
jgi:hypothetical protein